MAHRGPTTIRKDSALKIQSHSRFHYSYPYYQDPSILGAKWYNYHLLFKEIKEAFDPSGISNSPKPLSLE
jgi:hypothetical protein